jgi:uncharacterized membrane protein
MTPLEGADAGSLAAILVMGAATYAMRAGGFYLMRHVRLTVRLRRMLETLPGAVVVATVLPIVVGGGIAAALAVAAAVLATLIRRNDFIAVITGMAVAAGIRAAGW